MSQINLFPLTILKDKIQMIENDKILMIEEIRNMKKNSKNIKFQTTTNAWTGDTQGFEFIHKNQKFKKLFNEIIKKVWDYLNCVEIDNKLIDIYVQRSWATISREKENIALHKHLQSHLSFAYYLKKSEGDANLLFVDETKHNEFLPGLFLSPSSNKKEIIKKRNIANSGAIVFEAKEDEIVIFPSKTSHQTQPNVKNNDRISLSADIFIAAKNSENMEHLVTPFKNWKTL